MNRVVRVQITRTIDRYQFNILSKIACTRVEEAIARGDKYPGGIVSETCYHIHPGMDAQFGVEGIDAMNVGDFLVDMSAFGYDPCDYVKEF